MNKTRSLLQAGVLCSSCAEVLCSGSLRTHLCSGLCRARSLRSRLCPQVLRSRRSGVLCSGCRWLLPVIVIST